jgi:hypothetical protein
MQTESIAVSDDARGRPPHPGACAKSTAWSYINVFMAGWEAPFMAGWGPSGPPQSQSALCDHTGMSIGFVHYGAASARPLPAPTWLYRTPQQHQPVPAGRRGKLLCQRLAAASRRRPSAAPAAPVTASRQCARLELLPPRRAVAARVHHSPHVLALRRLQHVAPVHDVEDQHRDVVLLAQRDGCLVHHLRRTQGRGGVSAAAAGAHVLEGAVPCDACGRPCAGGLHLLRCTRRACGAPAGCPARPGGTTACCTSWRVSASWDHSHTRRPPWSPVWRAAISARACVHA